MHTGGWRPVELEDDSSSSSDPEHLNQVIAQRALAGRRPTPPSPERGKTMAPSQPAVAAGRLAWRKSRTCCTVWVSRSFDSAQG